jgi:MFS family permease
MFSILHLVCGSKRRAMAVAITFFFANLIGLGGGPAITGYLSDQFTVAYGPVGLRYALVLAMLLMVPAGLLLLQTQRTLNGDLEA